MFPEGATGGAAARRFPDVGMSRRSAAVDLLIVVGLLQIVYLLVIGTDVARRLEERFPSLGILWSNAIIGLMSLGIVYLILAGRGQRWSDIGLGRTSWKRAVGGAAAAAPACYVFVIASVTLYMALAGVSIEAMVEERAAFFEVVPELSARVVIPFSFFVGLHEEALFRGLVLTRLRAIFGSTAPAVAVSALLFGALHAYQGPIGVVQTTAAALVFATAAAWMRSLWPAVIAHGVFDCVGLVVIPMLREEMLEALEEMTRTATTTAPW